jgi:hypothetical protein
MPLSGHEQWQFKQIEQALRADDPRLRTPCTRPIRGVHYKRRVIGVVLGFVIGVGLLLTGVVSDVILFAVGLRGHARQQHVGGKQLPAHDRQRHRSRPPTGLALWQQAARPQGPALRQAGEISAKARYVG